MRVETLLRVARLYLRAKRISQAQKQYLLGLIEEQVEKARHPLLDAKSRQAGEREEEF